MSVTINFDTLKFNLYEILNIPSNADDHKIKKSFKTLILNFHPDKNNEAEENIYHHILTANQILLNKESRKLYDEYLNQSMPSHFDLKKNFQKVISNPEKVVSADSRTLSFNQISSELDKKHNINNYNKKNVLHDYEKIIQDREQSLNITKENIINNDDFNLKFENKKETNSGDIILNENKTISCYNDNYTPLDLVFNNLYIELNDTSSTKYSSITDAFKLQNISSKDIKNNDIKEAMKNYKLKTDEIINIFDPKQVPVVYGKNYSEKDNF